MRSEKEHLFRVVDLHKYLTGAWKRSLDWREFGHSFSFVKSSNTFVVVEDFHRATSDPHTRYLKWNFGKGEALIDTVPIVLTLISSLKGVGKEDLRFGYVMKVVSNPKSSVVHLEWDLSGMVCFGTFIPATGLAVLNFFLAESSVVVTYRAIDENTLAVCIVECDSKKSPSIQYGNMSRLDLSLYL